MANASLDTFIRARKVSRRDIRRLYESDALGMLDEELLDKVIYAVHSRVVDMFIVQAAQKHGRVECRNCGAPVPQRFRMGTRARQDVLRCEQCGWQVTCCEFLLADPYVLRQMRRDHPPGRQIRSAQAAFSLNPLDGPDRAAREAVHPGSPNQQKLDRCADPGCQRLDGRDRRDAQHG